MLFELDTCLGAGLVDAGHSASAGSGADVDEQDFAFFDVLDAIVGSLSADQTLHDEDGHVDGDEHLRHGARTTDDVAHHVVRASELGVNTRSHGD